MNVEVRRLDGDLEADFFKLHCQAPGGGWCFCAAWWVPDWQGWGERTAAQNWRVREELFMQKRYDGYIVHLDGEPAGWCQVNPRDQMWKLVNQFERTPDPYCWAITCFFVAPQYQKKGLSRHLIQFVLADLPGRGALRVEAFPKRGPQLDPLELWNGPEQLFLDHGFFVVQDDPDRPVLALHLPPPT